MNENKVGHNLIVCLSNINYKSLIFSSVDSLRYDLISISFKSQISFQRPGTPALSSQELTPR